MFISILVPVFNEADNISAVYEEIVKYVGQYHYELVFINDGSSDATADVLKELSELNSNVEYINFSRNFGHQNALKAGLDFSNGDCVVSLDGDMQHPPSLIPTLVEKWKEGYDIVYTKREEDPDLSFFKRTSLKLLPSIVTSFESFAPEISENVGKKSIVVSNSLLVTPSSI